MVTISLCMIVRDEEAVLKRCLDSAQGIWDELIVVDTGSTDRTREIAGSYTGHVYRYPWTDDFAAARNYSFSQARMDYCLWLDADDILTQDNRRRVLELKASLSPDTDVVMMRYHTAFDEQGKPVFSYYRERLIRNAPGWRWQGRVHEVIVPAGKVLYSDIAVEHRKLGQGDPDRNLRIYQKQLSEQQPLSPREQFYYGRELYSHGRLDEAVEVLSSFLEEGEGWVENNLEACRQLSGCLKEMGRKREALHALLRGLEYDLPRAELCCDIGQWFLEEQRWKQAAYWYEAALNTTQDDTSGGFIQQECYGYLPAIQLCVCYDRMGEYQKAQAYNELAGKFRPDSKAYQLNRSYFEAKNQGGEDSHAR